MLVLSRRESGKLLFPGLGISIEVLRVGQTLVKLGVIAPASVLVVRDEVTRPGLRDGYLEPSERLQFRNRINELTLRLQLIQKCIDHADYSEAVLVWEDLLAALNRTGGSVQVDSLRSESPICEAVRVLVVDDNANERQLLVSLLRLSGFHVDVAADGDEALCFLSTNPLPHCVLLDINMPRVDGNRVLRSIRGDSRYQHLCVFGVTGEEPRSELEMPGGLRSFDDWFPKPVDPDQLLAAIKRSGNSTAMSPASFSSLSSDHVGVQESIHGFA